MALGVAVVGLRQGSANFLFLVLSSTITAIATQQVIGIMWFRERPFVQLRDWPNLVGVHPSTKSFPSDHAAAAFALAITTVLHHQPFAAFWVGVAGLIAFSRHLAGVHYISDILVGAAIGTLFALLIPTFFNPIWPHLFTPLF